MDVLIKLPGIVFGNRSSQLDHSLVYTILRSSVPRTRSRKICFQSLKNFSRQNFVHDMQIVPFHITDLIDELDDKLYAFEQLFLSVRRY